MRRGSRILSLCSECSGIDLSVLGHSEDFHCIHSVAVLSKLANFHYTTVANLYQYLIQEEEPLSPGLLQISEKCSKNGMLLSSPS